MTTNCRNSLTSLQFSLSSDHSPSEHSKIPIVILGKMKKPPKASMSGLESLPLSINRYPYKGTTNFLDIYLHEESLCNEVFLMTNLNPQTFDHDFCVTETEIPYKSPKEYCAETHILLVPKQASLQRTKERERCSAANSIAPLALQVRAAFVKSSAMGRPESIWAEEASNDLTCPSIHGSLHKTLGALDTERSLLKYLSPKKCYTAIIYYKDHSVHHVQKTRTGPGLDFT
jgi:hypothetical protein